MITFSWNSVPNATAYSVAWAPTLSGNKKILVASQAETSYSFDGSHVDDPYYVNRDTYMFVRALDGSNYVSSDWASVVMQMREVSIAGSHVSSTLAIGDYRVVVGTVVPSFTITPDKGYQLTAEDISIVNNGVDITSQVYNANTHTVSSFVVNGSVQVLATAVQAQLAAPVISLSGSIVSWAAVPDAESYKLYVDGQFTANLGNELSVDLSQVIALKVPYTVNVLAHASGFKDSELSNTISYTPKPDAPVLTLDGSILSWTAIPSATKYTLVAISNSLSLSKTKTVGANTTSIDLTTWTDLVPSFWIIGAIAYVGDVRSDTSATVTYVNTIQLATPTIAMNADGKTLEITGVPNATSYDVYIDGTMKTNVASVPNTTTFDLSTLSDITDGAHIVKVKAKADGYRDSEFSNEVSYTKAPAGYKVTFASNFSSVAWGEGEITDITLTADTGVSTVLSSAARGLVWQGVSTLTASRGVANTIQYTNDRTGVSGYFYKDLTLSDDITITSANDSCLTGDMLITLADGTTKRIDTITLADKVLAYNPETMALEADEIISCDSDKIKTHDNFDIWTFDDGTIIKTVHRHRFYNVERNAMVYMDEWKIGEHAIKMDGTKVALVNHANVQEEVRHYTIFTKHQNYFANGLLSGNRYTERLVFGN